LFTEHRTVNTRTFTEWSDRPPSNDASGHIEAEFIATTGRPARARVHRFHLDAGPTWGHTTGSWKDETFQYVYASYYRWRYIGPDVPTKRTQGSAIIVWRFRDAPGELASLSPHGGDEDWVALVPVDGERPSWTENTSFGYCDVSEHELPDGRLVLIGAHA
jgi:hypothetical protein